jgi:hypothetical protein
VVGIFPNEAAIYRWTARSWLNRTMSERYSVATLRWKTLAEVGDDPTVSLSAVAV